MGELLGRRRGLTKAPPVVGDRDAWPAIASATGRQLRRSATPSCSMTTTGPPQPHFSPARVVPGRSTDIASIRGVIRPTLIQRPKTRGADDATPGLSG